MILKSILGKPLLALAIMGILGSAIPAFSIGPQALNFRDRFQGAGHATRVFTNSQVYPLILDVFNIQSSTGDPVFLQVSNTGILFDATVGPVGNYAFLMTGQWPVAPAAGEGEPPAPPTYFCTANTTIVILPGDSFRFYSINGASFSISVSGHYNYGSFPPI